MRRNRRLVGVGMLTIVGVVTWWALHPSHTIANGAALFQRITAIDTVAPTGSVGVHSTSTAATWIGGCSQIPGSRAGWTTDTASVMFTDTRSRTVVTSELDAHLRSLGWVRHDASPGPHQGRIAHWTLDVHSGHSAQAWAFPVGPGTSHWYVGASWTPPGPRGEGCP